MSIQQAVPCFTLNDGHKIPAIGCGTYLISVDEVSKMVETAIKVGYRHIDCAETYGNEEGVGRGIKKCIEEGIVRREELFVTSKLWIDHKEEVKKSSERDIKEVRIRVLRFVFDSRANHIEEGSRISTKEGGCYRHSN